MESRSQLALERPIFKPDPCRLKYYETMFPVELVLKFLNIVTGIDLNDKTLCVNYDFTFSWDESGTHFKNLNLNTPMAFKMRLMTNNPGSIHFGAVGNFPNSVAINIPRSGTQMQKIIRSFVWKIEIDLNEIPGRVCCGESKKCCSVCWDKWVVPLLSFFSTVPVERYQRRIPLFFYSGSKSLYVIFRDPEWCGILQSRPFFLDLQERAKEFLGLGGMKKNLFDIGVSLSHNHLIRLPFSPRVTAENGQNLVIPIIDIKSPLSDLIYPLDEVMSEESKTREKFLIVLKNFADKLSES